MNLKFLQKAALLVLVLFCCIFANSQEEAKTLYIIKNGVVFCEIPVSEIDSITFYNPFDPNGTDSIEVENIILDTTTITLAIGEKFTLTATVLPENATDKTVTWISSNNDNVSVNNGLVTAIAPDTVSITAKAGNKIATCVVKVKDGIKINDITWATRNVNRPGVFTAKPEDPGMFYQWNRPIGWSANDPMIDSNGNTTWNNNYPTGNIWETTNNVCPTGWRVPTATEIQKLMDSGSTWGNLNGINGRFFGSGNNTIFLPATGERDISGGMLMLTNIQGYYWSSTTNGNDGPWYMLFDNEITVMYYLFNNGAYGHSVRCVLDE